MSNPESSIASARASVMVYDDANKKWLPSGTSSGLSRVHIYQHIQNNTFRVVGRKLQDHEVVINCAILKNLKYNQATPIFHQWRENRTVFGLNFSSKEEADAFAHTMMKVIDLLNQNTYGTTKSIQQQPPPQQNSQQPVYGHIGPPEEYGEIGRQQQNGWNGNPNGGVNNQMQPHNNHINGLVDPQQQQQQNGGGPPPMHMQANSHNSQMQQPPPQMHQQMMPPEVVQHHQQLQQQQQNMQQLTQHMTNVTLSQAMLQTQATYMSTGNMMNMHRNSVSNVNNSQQQQQQIQQPANNIPPPPPPPPPMPTTNGQPMMAANMVSNNTGMMNGVAPAGPTGAPPPPPPPPPPGMLNGGGGPGSGGPPRMVSNGGQASSIPPAPPMPTMPLGGNSGGPANLAAALANAKLKKTTPSAKMEDNDSLSSNSSSGRTSNTTAAAPGNFMDEMAKTLARRRAQAESNQQNDGDSGSAAGNIAPARNFNGIKSSEKQSSTSLVNGCSPSKDESNSHHRKNGPSDESKFNGICEADMDRLKQEIMTDIRKELQKLKLDIIEAVKVELNRR